MLFTLKGKHISGVYGDYPDDAAAIAQARMYFRSSAADTLYVHRGNGFFPLGELIIELTKEEAT